MRLTSTRGWVRSFASPHRPHHHALAKGMTPRVVMAELWGRTTGCAGGRGGTMHLNDFSLGYFGSNDAPQRLHSRLSGNAGWLRPQCVENVAAQFGQTIRRFCKRLSSRTPFTCSRIKLILVPLHISP